MQKATASKARRLIRSTESRRGTATQSGCKVGFSDCPSPAQSFGPPPALPLHGEAVLS